jgi:hypothetical protein
MYFYDGSILFWSTPKVVHEVKAMCRRSLGLVMSIGEIDTSSLESLSSVDMNTPVELHDYLDVRTPVKSRDTTPRSSTTPTKPRSKLPQPIRFLGLPKAATGSGQSLSCSHTNGN